MDYFQAMILGVVEGLTEFLPVSSTFHLIWSAKLTGIPESNFVKVFEVAIQGGAILAVFFLYTKYFFNQKNIKTLAFSFLPTMVVGLVLYKVIKGFFFSDDLLQLFVFIFMGFIFIIFEYIYWNKPLDKNLDLSYKQAIFVGLMQSLAVIPGVSRAGVVILSLLLLKVKRTDAAKFSFLLAVPTIIAASIYDLWKSKDVLISQSNYLPQLGMGFIVAFVVALIMLKWFIKYLQNHTLVVFGYYRLIVGFFLLAYLLIPK